MSNFYGRRNLSRRGRRGGLVRNWLTGRRMDEDEDEDNGANNEDEKEEGEKQDGNGGNDNDTEMVYPTDFSEYSCDDIWIEEEEIRCNYAKTCNNGSGLLLAHYIFCQDRYAPTTLALLASPFIFVGLICLFRMLGSTAEDFFSPSLEMFSVRLGLPPRFAGVTLLALGNGAADVSATVNAITSDVNTGYKMALGALTGAGMFVGTIVAGLVILSAEGVPCRGALIRDVLAYILAMWVVYLKFESGYITSTTTRLLVFMYIGFVLVVLAADVYHRAVVLPKLARLEARKKALEAAQGLPPNDGRKSSQPQSPKSPVQTVLLRESVEIMTPRAVEEQSSTSSEGSNSNMPLMHTYATSDSQLNVTPIRPARFTEIESSSAEAPSASQEGSRVYKSFSAFAQAMSNYSQYEPNSFRMGWGDDGNDHSLCTVVEAIRDTHGRPTMSQSDELIEENEEGSLSAGFGPSHAGQLASKAPYVAMGGHFEMDEYWNPCVDPGNSQKGERRKVVVITFQEAWEQNKYEFLLHMREFFDDIYRNEDNNVVDVFFLTLEIPTLLLRKFTVALPTEGPYCRPILAITCALSPIWLAYYFEILKEVGIFVVGGVPVVGTLIITGLLVGYLVARYAPHGDGPMALFASVPLAFWGFIIAATWIDTIAECLISVLSYTGVMCRIPGSIMGLTILAWGNSMGDLSANITMARKGLANMAMTACFAGPLFNMLVGIGVGFSMIRETTHRDSKSVELNKSIKVGFLFLVLNCLLIVFVGLVMNNNRIPQYYGYIALVLYAMYIIISIVTEYTEM
eukprot:CAMPEP_0113310300 /NCGR_PEP_ID=MMETSP0010_2-20120614/8000_1 /TAXON_ID=216773 ORGANISM="Corethron hystrix, Strain 308" /NCGR_SAMPLE_ID=MMETSP0010_2 /ASSEMBLY_ACC=CAM_ASM_000155 /LENGTH=796 /DNA_ID=CAMNT_0000165727 /DNA_START=302 /DNA_END=2692 /DNA_ORIENTATION=- /assembly_acc=CAM_ASM_000155